MKERTAEAKDDLAEEIVAGRGNGRAMSIWNRIGVCFFTVFIAEWGDRTQIAQISLQASLPVLPVCMGSLFAYFLLTVSAVAVASFLEGRQLNERLILGVSAICFLIFAIISLMEGFASLDQEKAQRLAGLSRRAGRL